MSTQLDILALEPFYGGIRRSMLETIIRHSRHRWTLLKLPPRRIERRLTAAAHWFAEQISRSTARRIDLLFTSEAMNLADMFRLTPELSRKPSVVYFHSNQLPDPASRRDTPLDLVNLNTATAAVEIWFNSLFHLRTFLARASALVEKHTELSTRNPMPELAAKAHLIHPPMDLAAVHELVEGRSIVRQKRTIFIDTRDADIPLLNAALGTLHRRNEKFSLITVGPANGLSEQFPRRAVSEINEAEQIEALHEAGLILSAKIDATADHHLVRGLVAGCWPIVPDTGVYPELLPESMHRYCLYDGSHDILVSRLLDTWHLERPGGYMDDMLRALQRYEAISACKTVDQRLEELTVVHSVIQ
ncbi:MAG: DUF3524 domain-containing protein [Phycisphaerales bacterium]|jgi:hypothetical protein|nr:DUF3524 domain-containing protein [Phycisphaerales bacterium]